MTHAMIRALMRLALTHLLELSEEELSKQEEWLKHEHIQWCLDNVSEMIHSQHEIEYVKLLSRIVDLWIRKES